MSRNRVIWSEGLFLRPHHFQQAERFLEHLIEERHSAMDCDGYGYAELQLDNELLKFGKLGLARASGVFPDGTPFDLPREASIPAPLDVPDDTRDSVVVLALPVRRPGMAEMAFEASEGAALVRYVSQDEEIRDAVAETDSTANLKVGRLNLRIMLRSELPAEYAGIAFARIREKRSDGQVIMDDQFIPTVVDCRASLRLYDFAREVLGMVKQRAIALADRISAPGTKGVADFSDFLLLQLCNRTEPLFAHLLQRGRLHPELLYRHLIMLAGDLATFGRQERGKIVRRPAEFPPYRHDEPDFTFRPVMDDIRSALQAVLEQNAIAIPLMNRAQGVYVGAINDVGLLRSAMFVLAVNADMQSEQLRVHFPTQVKIGPVDKIRDLVMSHLPGIVAQPQPVAPREIPYHAGFTYFELDRKSEFWRAMEASRAIALHIAGDFPGMQIELWAIRRAG